jgi:CRISPR/Cas system-associated exonuclease Cas4 (RecB family)
MHIYECNGKQFPSVTTIIHLISINDGLLNWANIMGFKRKYIKHIQEESAAFGTLVHEQLQGMIDSNFTESIIVDKIKEYEINKVKNKFSDYFKDIEYKTINTELSLVSEIMEYGGTLDWLTKIKINNKYETFLLDFKTSKSIKTTMYLQLGAYYLLLKENNINVDKAGIIIINERECSLYPIEKKILEEFGELFILLLNFYKLWIKKEKFKPNMDIIRNLKKQNNNIIE